MLVAAIDATDVTAAGTIAQQRDRLVVVRYRQIIIGVTSGAVGLIGRKWPGDDLVVGSVAIDAKYRGAVVAGIIRRVVPEVNQGYPHCRAVTAVAIQCCDEMCRRFTGRNRAVVAGQAKTGDHRVVERCRYPGAGEVTAVAFGRGWQVGRWLARCSDAVVAG